MELNNCLICLCHKDNKNYNKCSGKRHIYKINQKQADKWNLTIDYIKQELETGRHLCACLGSAGLTFLTDIEIFKNYCYSQDKYLYNLLEENN